MQPDQGEKWGKGDLHVVIGPQCNFLSAECFPISIIWNHQSFDFLDWDGAGIAILQCWSSASEFDRANVANVAMSGSTNSQTVAVDQQRQLWDWRLVNSWRCALAMRIIVAFMKPQRLRPIFVDCVFTHHWFRKLWRKTTKAGNLDFSAMESDSQLSTQGGCNFDPSSTSYFQ